jgi:hypothetical protein
MTKLKVGVAGAGVFGNYHAQKAAASVRTDLIGVYDIDLARATRIAEQFGAKGFDDYQAFSTRATPSSSLCPPPGMSRWPGRRSKPTAMCCARSRWP